MPRKSAYGERCTYGGTGAECWDHLIPKRESERLGIPRSKVPTVPSCTVCNALLSDLIMPDIKDRREYIRRRELERANGLKRGSLTGKQRFAIR